MILDDAHEAEVDEENYFVSMTDMMVGLVFIFIIMLMYFALQFQDVTDKVTGANEEREKILDTLETSLRDKGVPVTIDKENGILRLPEAILFDSGQAELMPSGIKAVGHLADSLAEILPCYTSSLQPLPVPERPCPPRRYAIESVYIEGHTDTDRFAGGGMMRDNMDLSALRATNTFRQIIDRRRELSGLCVWKDKMCSAVLSVSGYGSERPVVRGTSREAKASNRRIDLRITMVAPDAMKAIGQVSDQLARK
jgi:flagellar motor protein MotB